ncbi:hypothetical protein AVEN_148717-1 [Araneus ventricosus]|uniref:Uncharacterized protein n=1 Tax=Araneus ventricosus TaxID=182803 RepID=A0A4Y2X4M6_ARAVE|nr:hypothetical protein AVEN_38084-1 [Araneus ventricosus]GBO44138.1 hypothetical protein AVEN_148717-1 [Araneus ventricosus]
MTQPGKKFNKPCFKLSYCVANLLKKKTNKCGRSVYSHGIAGVPVDIEEFLRDRQVRNYPRDSEQSDHQNHTAGRHPTRADKICNHSHAHHSKV